MKKTLLSVLGVTVVLLTGCASEQSSVVSFDQDTRILMGAQSCCSNYAEMPITPLAGDGSESVFTLDAHSPVYHFSDGPSYFQAFQLPENKSQVELTISSYFSDKVLQPAVMLLDKDLNVLQTLGASDFKVVYGAIGRKISLQSRLTIDRSQKDQAASFVIVKSDPSSVGRSITIMSAARVWAKETGLATPVESDPIYPYAVVGEIGISAKESGYPLQEGKALRMGSAEPSVATSSLTIDKARAFKRSVAGPMLGETERFYLTQIEKAVQAGDIDKAMKLVDEAERAGSTKAKTTFVEAVKRSQK